MGFICSVANSDCGISVCVHLVMTKSIRYLAILNPCYPEITLEMKTGDMVGAYWKSTVRNLDNFQWWKMVV